MPKQVTLDTFKGRVQFWVDDTGDMQVVINYEVSGSGVSVSKSKDVTPTLTTAQRKVAVDLAKSLLAATKQQEGV